MKYFRLAPTRICLLAIQIVFFSASVSGNDAVDSLTEKLGKLESIDTNFVQFVVDKSGTTVQESRGMLRAKRPGLFYWHTEPPLEQVVVSDGVNIIVYDPDLEQATVQPVSDEVSATPALLFSGDVSTLGENYNVHYKNWDETIDQYILMPKNADSLFETLRLRFEKDVLVEMRLTDSLGQKSTISFSAVKINSGLTNESFQFIIPDGTDVIRELTL